MKKTILYLFLALVSFLYGQTQLDWNSQLRNRPNITRTGSNATWTDNLTLSGTGTFSNTNTFTGLTSVKNQSNVRWVDGTTYACSDVGLNAAITDVIANDASGGTVYARCPGTNTIASTVNVGSSTANVALMLLGHSVWNCTINNAANDCWFVFPNSTLEGLGHGANFQQLTMGAAASVRSIVKTFSHITPGVASHMSLKNLEVHNQSSGTIANALVDIQGAYDASFWNLTIDAFTGRGLWIHDFTSPAGGNSLNFYNILLDGRSTAGAQPLIIEMTASGSNTSAINFWGGDFGHPGTGQNLILLNGHGFAGFGQISFNNIYMESNLTDTTTAIIQVTDTGQVAFNNVRIAKLAGTSTATGLSLTQTASNLLYGITATNFRTGGGNGGSSNAITNNQAAGYTVAQAANAIPFYAYQSSDGNEISQIGPMIIPADGSVNLKNTFGVPAGGTASQEKCYYDTTAQARKCSYNNGAFSVVQRYSDTTNSKKVGSGNGTNYNTTSTTAVVMDSTNLCLTTVIPTGFKLTIQAFMSATTITGVAQYSVFLSDNAACSTANAGILATAIGNPPVQSQFESVALGYQINGDGATHNVALQFSTNNAADAVNISNSNAANAPVMLFALGPSN